MKLNLISKHRWHCDLFIFFPLVSKYFLQTEDKFMYVCQVCTPYVTILTS